MFTAKISPVIAAIYYLLTAQAIANPVADSCLRLVCVDAQFDTLLMHRCSNPDSVRIDTCSSSPTFNQLYGKRWFYIKFTHYVIDLPQAPADTILEVSWTAIDTAYPSLRTAFAALESKYGTLHMMHPEFRTSS
jgi:hypothetical protein